MVNPIFYNSDYVVIEYIDLIKSPYLVLLNLIRTNPKMGEILNIDEIRYMDDASLYEWYVNRKHQNFFMDLVRPDIMKTNPNQYHAVMNQLLDDQISISDRFYSDAILLPLGGSLKFIKRQSVCKDIIIYHPHPNKFAEENLHSLVGESFTWMSDWDKVMEKAGANSTYFLSDIHKVERMRDAGILEFSSITLPQEYRYNKKNMKDYRLDFDAMMKANVFKLSFIAACLYKKEEN